jgi:hypothetical protein
MCPLGCHHPSISAPRRNLIPFLTLPVFDLLGAISCVFLLLGVLAILELHMKANARDRPGSYLFAL